MRKVIGSGLSEGGIGVFHSKSGSSKKILPINKEGLVFYMPAEKSVWNMVFDCSGKNNHGTRYGAFVTNNGKVGKGLQFDGIDDYVNCGDTESLNFGINSFSVELWVYSTLIINLHTFLIAKHPSWGQEQEGWGIRIFNDGSIRIDLNDGTGHCFQNFSGTIIDDGIWHNIAMVVDRASDKLIVYFDGINKGTRDIASIGSINTNRHLSIGSSCNLPVSNNQDYHFNGKIDEIKIYNRALSPEEIFADYQREV